MPPIPEARAPVRHFAQQESKCCWVSRALTPARGQVLRTRGWMGLIMEAIASATADRHSAEKQRWGLGSPQWGGGGTTPGSPSASRAERTGPQDSGQQRPGSTMLPKQPLSPFSHRPLFSTPGRRAGPGHGCPKRGLVKGGVRGVLRLPAPRPHTAVPPGPAGAQRGQPDADACGDGVASRPPPAPLRASLCPVC